MAHADVAESVEHPLMGKDSVREREFRDEIGISRHGPIPCLAAALPLDCALNSKSASAGARNFIDTAPAPSSSRPPIKMSYVVGQAEGASGGAPSLPAAWSGEKTSGEERCEVPLHRLQRSAGTRMGESRA